MFENVANSGRDYAFVYTYDESHVGKPLNEEGSGISDITGLDGQEDDVVRSVITANHAIGTDVA